MEIAQNTNDDAENINQGCNNGSEFPNGMRVLVADDNVTSLRILTVMLKKCRYQVTSLNNKTEALEVLNQNAGYFDIVLTNVCSCETEGFKLLEAGIALDIPVVVISANDDKDIIMKGVEHGVVNYLRKPLRFEDAQIIWQHVYRKKLSCSTLEVYQDAKPINDFQEEILVEDFIRSEDENLGHHHDPNESIVNQGMSSKSSKKGLKRKSPPRDDSRNVAAIGNGDNDNNITEKRERIKWSSDLNRKFIQAVDELGGFEKAVPKKILERMHVPGLTREQVASHLQKFRKSKKKGEYCERVDSNNHINYNYYCSNHPSHTSPTITTLCHQPNLGNTSQMLLPGRNYQHDTNNNNNNNHLWRLPSSSVAYTQQLSQHWPVELEQPRFSNNNRNDLVGQYPNSTFQQFTQDGSFVSMLHTPQVFDSGPSMVDSTYLTSEFPQMLDFAGDSKKLQNFRTF